HAATGALQTDGNGSASFDGTNGQVVIGDAALLRPANEMSVEAWIKPTGPIGPNDQKVVLTKTTSSGWSDGYGIYYHNGRLFFWVNEASSVSVSAPVSLDEWSQVVGTYDPA